MICYVGQWMFLCLIIGGGQRRIQIVSLEHLWWSLFAKIVSDFYSLPVFAKSSFIDIPLGSKYASGRELCKRSRQDRNFDKTYLLKKWQVIKSSCSLWVCTTISLKIFLKIQNIFWMFTVASEIIGCFLSAQFLLTYNY